MVDTKPSSPSAGSSQFGPPCKPLSGSRGGEPLTRMEFLPAVMHLLSQVPHFAWDRLRASAIAHARRRFTLEDAC